jgi:hypothetical protein
MQIIQFIPKLSATGKLPCASFSIPAQACKTGGKLAKIKGSVCSDCYALKGSYRYPTVMAHRSHNLNSMANLDDWTANMIKLIHSTNETGYFRWFDSGDVQSAKHLEAIIDIAEALPDVRFWLPTKEAGIIKRNKRAVPDNLAIRLSMPMIDQLPTGAWKLTSTVRSAKGDVQGAQCKAPSNNGKCGTCRDCWDTSISNITYIKH